VATNGRFCLATEALSWLPVGEGEKQRGPVIQVYSGFVRKPDVIGGVDRKQALISLDPLLHSSAGIQARANQELKTTCGSTALLPQLCRNRDSNESRR
jgi:hypothetical protein